MVLFLELFDVVSQGLSDLPGRVCLTVQYASWNMQGHRTVN